MLTDLADVVERCPDAFSRLHLRNLARIAHETVVALAAAASAYATQTGRDWPLSDGHIAIGHAAAHGRPEDPGSLR